MADSSGFSGPFGSSDPFGLSSFLVPLIRLVTLAYLVCLLLKEGTLLKIITYFFLYTFMCHKFPPPKKDKAWLCHFEYQAF